MSTERIYESTLNLPLSDEPSVSPPGSSCSQPDLPRYSVLHQHAEGGLGRIFVVHDNDLQRQVVLKELKPQLTSPRAQQRFLREAQVTGQLEHPNIVPVYELSQREDGSPYYIMRYLRGQTFKEAIREYHKRRKHGKATLLDEHRLLETFLAVCQAIAYAHSRGVLHRDLKPENVMLGRFGEVIVLDWGLARVLGQADEQTTAVQVEAIADAAVEETLAGEVLGTPAYMAPEQAEGRQDLMDYTTDVYGLGGILFEILTGRPPHQGQSSGELLNRILKQPTPTALSVDSQVSKVLNAICAKAMARNQSHRYESATELAEDVRCHMADEPVTAYRMPWTQRIFRWARRNRAWTVGIASVLFIAIVLTSISAFLMAGLAQKEKEARVTAEARREQALRLSATFAARTVASEMDLRWRILETEASNARLQRLLGRLNQTADPITDRDWPMIKSWVEGAFQRHATTTKASSWFLNDARGIHLARHPFSPSIVGRNYSFRDYFHGQGRDLSPEEAKDVKPLREVHRSIVFTSQANGSQMVAFSVPIWNDAIENEPRRILGVLGMSVELGRFSVLQVGLSDKQVAVLVETKSDGIQAKGARGLILHHPHLAAMRKKKSLSEEERRHLVVRLPESRVEALCHLREKKLEQSHQNKITPLGEAWDSHYHDPMEDDRGNWLAAFEPVLIPGRPKAIQDTGWVVIVQERAQR